MYKNECRPSGFTRADLSAQGVLSAGSLASLHSSSCEVLPYWQALCLLWRFCSRVISFAVLFIIIIIITWQPKMKSESWIPSHQLSCSLPVSCSLRSKTGVSSTSIQNISTCREAGSSSRNEEWCDLGGVHLKAFVRTERWARLYLNQWSSWWYSLKWTKRHRQACC